MTSVVWGLPRRWRETTRDRIGRRRSEGRARLVERAAKQILAEPEFARHRDVGTHHDELVGQARRQADVVAAQFFTKRGAFRRRCVATTASGLAVAALLAPVVTSEAASTIALSVWNWAGLAGRVALVAAAAGIVTGLLRRAGGLGVRLANEWRHYRAALPEHVRPLLRRAVLDVADTWEAPVLRLTSTPDLSTSYDRRYRVPRPEQAEIDTLVRRLHASAVAISGPRGAGKTALLRDLAEGDGPERALVVQVEAASSFPARDFIITLGRELCRTVLTEIRYERRWLLTGRPMPLFRRWATWRMRRRAEETLERLQYLQNLSSETSGTLKLPFKVGLDLGGKRSRQLIEQPTSLAEVVRSFRSFAAEVAGWWKSTQRGGGRLVVIVDELDRINDGEAAERFINEIKGIFGAVGVTYLVAVSEDALALFERRTVGIRSALDSTFDEAVRLDLFSLEDSVELLGRRLVGCPRPFVALCHALSGGLPRELLRTAREMVKKTGAGAGDLGLDVLTERVVHHDIRQLKHGFTPRLRSAGSTGPVHQVLKDLADPGWPGTDAAKLLEHGVDLIRPVQRTEGEAERDCLRLGVSLWYYATIMETFGLKSEPVRPCHEELPRAAEGLAAVRNALPVSAELALDRLTALRRELGLPIPDARTGKPATSDVGATP